MLFVFVCILFALKRISRLWGATGVTTNCMLSADILSGQVLGASLVWIGFHFEGYVSVCTCIV